MMRRSFLARVGACATSITLGRHARAQSPDALELVLKGGTIVDPANGIQARADIGFRGGRIAALEPEIAASRAARVIDVSGKLVTPGLIDLHAKVYDQPVGAIPGQIGVTTCVSGGEASAYELAAFRRHAARYARCRVYAFVHLGGPRAARDAASKPPNPIVADVGTLARLLAQNRDLVIGVTVQPAAATGGQDERRALEHAIAVVEAAQTRGRVMCNVAGVGRDSSELLERLRPGDILTHAYSPARPDLVAHGKLNPAALAARRRGVVIDVGHGGEHFDPSIARAAIAQGFAPDVISTGAPALRTGSTPPPSLTEVMSRFLNLGFSLEQVVAMATINPARLIGREPKLGTLDLGAPADVSIFELREAPIEFIDAGGARWTGSRSLQAVQAIRAAAPAAKSAR